MCNKHSSLTAKIKKNIEKKYHRISYSDQYQLVLGFLNSYFRHMFLKGGKFLLDLGILTKNKNNNNNNNNNKVDPQTSTHKIIFYVSHS